MTFREPPRDQSEFLAAIESIDATLKARQVPIHARPLQAGSEFCRQFHMSLPVAPIPTEPEEGSYSGGSLAARIHRWYEEQYGDRLKINMSPGSVAFQIRGDLWRIDLPLVFGRFQVICYPQDTPDRNMPVIDVFHHIQGLTSAAAQSLTEGERFSLRRFFVFALDTLSQLSQFFDAPHLCDARQKWDASIGHLFAQPPAFHLAKWDALEAAERAIKSFSDLVTGKHQNIHDITRLLIDAENAGMRRIPQPVVLPLQMNAAVRYGKISVNQTEALAAHHAALLVLRHALEHIGEVRKDRRH